jgi:hypothetical protein
VYLGGTVYTIVRKTSGPWYWRRRRYSIQTERVTFGSYRTEREAKNVLRDLILMWHMAERD